MNFEILIKYIFLGIIQGLTEPLPISSSGHLLIIKSLLNTNILNDINFEIIVNFGSFLGILYLYKNEIINIIRDFFKFVKTKKLEYKNNYNYTWKIVISTIPAGVFGIILKDKIDLISNNLKLIGLALLITSIFLFLIKDITGKKEKKDITIKDSIIIGLFQVIALFPGISRSGSTIVGGMISNLKRKTAADFSFMLYLPISIASMALGIKDLFNVPNISKLFIPYFISMLFSMITTYYSAKWFINIIKKGKLIYFSVYCIIVGLLVLIFI